MKPTVIFFDVGSGRILINLWSKFLVWCIQLTKTRPYFHFGLNRFQVRFLLIPNFWPLNTKSDISPPNTKHLSILDVSKVIKSNIPQNRIISERYKYSCIWIKWADIKRLQTHENSEFFLLCLSNIFIFHKMFNCFIRLISSVPYWN